MSKNRHGIYVALTEWNSREEMMCEVIGTDLFPTITVSVGALVRISMTYVMQKNPPNPPEQGSVYSCKCAARERPLILVRSRLAYVKISSQGEHYLPVIRYGRVAMLEIGEHHDPIIMAGR